MSQRHMDLILIVAHLSPSLTRYNKRMGFAHERWQRIDTELFGWDELTRLRNGINRQVRRLNFQVKIHMGQDVIELNFYDRARSEIMNALSGLPERFELVSYQTSVSFSVPVPRVNPHSPFQPQKEGADQALKASLRLLP